MERWIVCNDGEPIQAAKTVGINLAYEAADSMKNGDSESNKLMSHAIKSQNLPRIQAMIEIAATEPGMSVSANALDADPMLLGAKNGVIDLRTGELLPYQPQMLITKYANANYYPAAPAKFWDKFLTEVFNGDRATIECLQRIVGYTITGSVTEEVMIICCGLGSNGKSVFNNVIMNILADYGRTAPASLLTKRKPGDTGPRNDLASLSGVRYASLNELEAGDRLDEQTVKVAVGREPITARFLYQELFTFTPTHKIWLRTNHKPVITGNDDGIWRRLVLIPFNRQFKDDEKDPNLEEKLLAERDGILAWMVEGSVKWQRSGLQLSPLIQRECMAYRKDSDLIGQFLEECCTYDPNGKITQRTLFSRWIQWCDTNGVRHGSKMSFTRRIIEHGLGETKSNGERYYTGINNK